MTPVPATGPLLIFDGDCSFCSSSARFARRWVDRRARFAIEPFQQLDLPALGLTVDDCEAAAWFVTGSGARHAGAQAISVALRSGAAGWPPIGRLLAAPGIRLLAAVVYRWVSANRYRLPGGTPHCSTSG